MKRTIPALLLGLVVLGAPACGTSTAPTEPEGTTEPAPAADAEIEKAVAVLEAIGAEPARAEAILGEHGLTAEQFETLMYDIAADPTRAAAFELARK
jgi:hypothetical protein